MARSSLEVRSPHEDWVLTTMARRSEVCRQLADDAETADDPRWWLALRRQGRSYLRHLDTWDDARTSPACESGAEEHRRLLGEYIGQADSHVADLDEAARADATARLGLRLAVIGKGGTGKTVVCATLARLLGRRGHRVLLADLDANPGLAYSLGVRPSDAGLPVDALEQHPGASYGWHLAADLSPADVVECLADPAPDGTSVLAVGKVGGSDGGPARSLVAVSEILLGLGDPTWHVIADMEAGPTTPYEGYHAFAEDVAVVVGPSWASALTARRLTGLIGDRSVMIVANRVSDHTDHPDLTPIVRIPFDPEVARAERLGLAPLDVCPDSPAVQAIAELAQILAPDRTRSAAA